MDGFKVKLGRSIQGRLLVGISAALVLFALASGLWSFVAAYQEANEFQDDQLRQIALIAQRGDYVAGTPVQAAPSTDADTEAQVVVWVLPASATDAGAGGSDIQLPANLQDGLQTVTIGSSGWRLFVHAARDGRRTVVGQQTEVRDATAIDSALRTAIPVLLFWPVLSGLICLLVRRAFRPVDELARSIDGVTERDLRPMQARAVPLEINPFIEAINRLIQRLLRAADTQRRFIADAAHELRSPLTALSVQIENAGGAMRTEPMAERLAPVRQGVARLGALMEQLLALARVQPDTAVPGQPLAVLPILRRVIQDLLPEVERKGIDLEIDCTETATVVAQDIELTLLLRNVLDNAVRYTPAGGRIEVGVATTPKATTIDIRDDGAGIPEAERRRVFDAFYRGGNSAETGSGLGLSIVRTIVDRLGGVVELGWADAIGRKGLHLRLCFDLEGSLRNVIDQPQT
ncbi:MAG: ATP-binding protein [Rhodospirillales bacterium]